MEPVTRRESLQAAVALSLVDGADDQAKASSVKKKSDRDFVVAAGMTSAEADCWELAAQLAGKFFALPKMHPMDAQEVAQAIHVIQNKLLSRPTYRKYLAEAKASQK